MQQLLRRPCCSSRLLSAQRCAAGPLQLAGGLLLCQPAWAAHVTLLLVGAPLLSCYAVPFRCCVAPILLLHACCSLDVQRAANVHGRQLRHQVLEDVREGHTLHVLACSTEVQGSGRVRSSEGGGPENSGQHKRRGCWGTRAHTHRTLMLTATACKRRSNCAGLHSLLAKVPPTYLCRIIGTPRCRAHLRSWPAHPSRLQWQTGGKG